MPKHRLLLHGVLVSILGSKNCYFQPPETVKMDYPCIVYKYDNNQVVRADDLPYLLFDRYIVTLITKNPEDPVIDKLSKLPEIVNGRTEIQSRFDRYFVADNLHHYSYVVQTN